MEEIFLKKCRGFFYIFTFIIFLVGRPKRSLRRAASLAAVRSTEVAAETSTRTRAGNVTAKVARPHQSTTIRSGQGVRNRAPESNKPFFRSISHFLSEIPIPLLAPLCDNETVFVSLVSCLMIGACLEFIGSNTSEYNLKI